LGSYRRRLDIIANILRVASRNAKKTQIMNQANLSYKVLQRYLTKIIEASLINFEDENQSYVLTAKGQEFLNFYKENSRTNHQIEKYPSDARSTKKVFEKLC
jgi:predicted transcriptional regulator